MNVPHWKQHVFTMLSEKMLSELGNMTEGQLRTLRGELSRYESVHTFEDESSRKAVRLYINVIGSLLLRT